MSELVKLSRKQENPRENETAVVTKAVKLSENQCSPRHTQDGGENTPAEDGKGGEFKASASKEIVGKVLGSKNSVSTKSGDHR